eukprot:3940228-Rhodomonas_salina.2
MNSTFGPTAYSNRLPSAVKSAPPFTLTSTTTVFGSSTAGSSHTMTLEETAMTAAPETDASPTRHCKSLPLKPVPVTWIEVWPLTGPRSGHSPSTRGISKYSKATPLCEIIPPSVLANWMTTGPTVRLLGVAQRMVRKSKTVLASARSPNMHCTSSDEPGKKLAETVSSEPPVNGPVLGTTERSTASSAYENSSPFVLLSTPLLLSASITKPGSRAGTLHVTTLDDTNKAAANTPSPNIQLRDGDCTKPTPITVTICPLVRVRAEDGLNAAMVPSCSYTYCFPSLVNSLPSSMLISRSTRPTSPGGITHKTSVDDSHLAPTAEAFAMPTPHSRPLEVKCRPITRTTPPPAVDPRLGTRSVT